MSDNSDIDHPPITLECATRAGQGCCLHLASQPFGLKEEGRAGMVIVNPQTCCWCGPLRVNYQGTEAAGHGPWVTFTPPSKLVLASGSLRRPGTG